MTEATIQSIDVNAKQMSLSFTDSYTCTEDDTIRTKEKIAEVFAFGTQPKLYDAFYIGSKEAFSKKGAKISLAFSLWIDDESAVLHSSRPEACLGILGWQGMAGRHDHQRRLRPVSERLRRHWRFQDNPVHVSCRHSGDRVFGQKNFWIRTRIIGATMGGSSIRSQRQ